MKAFDSRLSRLEGKTKRKIILIITNSYHCPEEQKRSALDIWKSSGKYVPGIEPFPFPSDEVPENPEERIIVFPGDREALRNFMMEATGDEVI